MCIAKTLFAYKYEQKMILGNKWLECTKTGTFIIYVVYTDENMLEFEKLKINN